MNNNFDGDAIESGKIALYALDGSAIIETDLVDVANDNVSAITAANYPVGTVIYPSNQNGTTTTLAKAGWVSKTAGSGGSGALYGAIGYVVGVRYLQNATPYPVGGIAGATSSQSYTSATENAAYLAETASTNGQPVYTPTTGTYSYKPQVNVPVLAIKVYAN